MKKFLSIILVIGIIFSCMAVSASAEGEAVVLTPEQKSLAKIKKADANGDGKYSTEDVRMVLRGAIGITNTGDACDVDSDGYTTTEDALTALKAASGIAIVSDEELLDVLNYKLNSVKTEMPGFTGVSSMKCTSMKVTQQGNADGGIMSGVANAVLKDMNCTDLEYDQYVVKMIEQLKKANAKLLEKEDSELTESEKTNKEQLLKEIAAMENSGETYKNPVVVEKTVVAGDIGHYKFFPREKNDVSSELTMGDIKDITYAVSKGEIVINLAMGAVFYTQATYPSSSTNIPYGKAFNIPDLRQDEGSTLTKGEYKNGKITLVLNKETGAIKNAEYGYTYSTNVKAPTQSQTDSTFGTITIEMSTKTTATVKESFTF